MVRKGKKRKVNEGDKDLVLEEMKELEKELDMKVRECPNCASFVPPGEDRCHSCGYDMTSVDDEAMEGEEDGEPETAGKPARDKGKKKEPRTGKKSEDDRIAPVLETMEELLSEDEEAEEEARGEAEVPETEFEEEPRSDYGKTMSFVVIMIGVATYAATPFVISEPIIAALALILGAFIIVIGGNMAYSSLQAGAAASEGDLATAPEEEVPEEEPEEDAEMEEEAEGEEEGPREEHPVSASEPEKVEVPAESGPEEVEAEPAGKEKEEDWQAAAGEKEEEEGQDEIAAETREPAAAAGKTGELPLPEAGTGTAGDEEIMRELKEEPFFKSDGKDVEVGDEIEKDFRLDDLASLQFEKVEKARAGEGPKEKTEESEFRNMSEDDSQLVELVPMTSAEKEDSTDTFKCPVCRSSLAVGATECAKCGALFDE